MDVKSTLEQAGLAGNEAKVYLALLDLGSALAGEITKKSGVNRTNVYDALDRLIEKGMASFVIQANRKYFEATTPDKLAKYLEEKEQEIQRKRSAVEKIIPQLKIRRKLGHEPQEATIYKGRKGLKSVTEDILTTKKPLFAFGAEGKFAQLFTHYFEQWHMRRGKLNIPVKVIFNEKQRKNKLKANFPKAELRFTTRESTPATTWIYGDKIAVVVWSEQPLVTVIRSREIAKSYKIFFESLWKSAKP